MLMNAVDFAVEGIKVGGFLCLLGFAVKKSNLNIKIVDRNVFTVLMTIFLGKKCKYHCMSCNEGEINTISVCTCIVYI